MKYMVCSLAVIILLKSSFVMAISETGFEEQFKSRVVPYFDQHFTTGAFTGKDGVRIEYAAYEREGEKGALVIVNGRTESYLNYREVVYDLEKSGLSIYTFDHRGQGLSGRMLADSSKGHVERYEDYLDDMKTFMETVVNKKPHNKVFALAHSMGGGVTALYAQRHPEKFDGLILSSPMLEIDFGVVPDVVVRYLVSFLDMVGLGRMYAPGKGPYKPEEFNGNLLTHSRARLVNKVRENQKYSAIRLGGATVRWVAQMIKMTGELRENAVKIKIPTLLLQASEDRIVNPAGHDEVCRNAPNCRKVVIEGARHEMLLESDPVRSVVMEKIISFLSGQPDANESR